MTMQSYTMQDTKEYNGKPVIVSMPAQKLDDDIVFSTFNLHFCNPCCLGFGAFYNSVKARDNRLLGDFASARSYSRRARRLNIASVILGFTTTILLIAFVFYAVSVSYNNH